MNTGMCPHCKMDKEIRNPSGFCDHLYYPDYCKVCMSISHSEYDGDDIIIRLLKENSVIKDENKLLKETRVGSINEHQEIIKDLEVRLKVAKDWIEKAHHLDGCKRRYDPYPLRKSEENCSCGRRDILSTISTKEGEAK